MVKRYKIKLSAESPAEHNVRGYLGGWGEIYTYSRGEAIKKARAFKGKIEPVSYGFISTDVCWMKWYCLTALWLSWLK
jgi:hypothetical protein